MHAHKDERNEEKQRTAAAEAKRAKAEAAAKDLLATHEKAVAKVSQRQKQVAEKKKFIKRERARLALVSESEKVNVSQCTSMSFSSTNLASDCSYETIRKWRATMRAVRQAGASACIQIQIKRILLGKVCLDSV